jgi:hypothetical protein
MRRLIIGILIGASIGASGAVASGIDSRATVGEGYGTRAVISGCDAEDTCRIGYHKNGNWTITRDRRH